MPDPTASSRATSAGSATTEPGAGRTGDRAVDRAAVALLLYLTLLNVLNFVDRTLIASLGPLLIADLGLSRTQIGWLAGFGFVVFYTLVGIFLGLAADRWPRLRLLAGGLALWSAMTAVSGLAKSFVHLAIPRVFVGIGEATLAPSALSMLGDAFPRRRLGLATGVYYTGVPLGMATSLIVGSVVAPRFGWRACFFLLGAIGLLAVVALRFFREPARRDHNPLAAARSQRCNGRRDRRCAIRCASCCATSDGRSPGAASSALCCSVAPCSATARDRRSSRSPGWSRSAATLTPARRSTPADPARRSPTSGFDCCWTR